jgi:hypothetical protein
MSLGTVKSALHRAVARPARAAAGSAGVSLFHGRWRRRTALLALGALDEAEAGRARAHVAPVPSVRRDLERTRAALALRERGPRPRTRSRHPAGALVDARPGPADDGRRSEDGLAAAPGRGRPWLAAWWWAGGRRAARALAPEPVASRDARHERVPFEAGPSRIRRRPWAASRPRSSASAAARYLSEAQDVLVTVASAPQRCARRRNAVEVGRKRSAAASSWPAAPLRRGRTRRPRWSRADVLDDVEEMLREGGRPRRLRAAPGPRGHPRGDRAAPPP